MLSPFLEAPRQNEHRGSRPRCEPNWVAGILYRVRLGQEAKKGAACKSLLRCAPGYDIRPPHSYFFSFLLEKGDFNITLQWCAIARVADFALKLARMGLIPPDWEGQGDRPYVLVLIPAPRGPVVGQQSGSDHRVLRSIICFFCVLFVYDLRKAPGGMTLKWRQIRIGKEGLSVDPKPRIWKSGPDWVLHEALAEAVRAGRGGVVIYPTRPTTPSGRSR